MSTAISTSLHTITETTPNDFATASTETHDSPNQQDGLADLSDNLWIYLSPFIFILGVLGHCVNLYVIRWVIFKNQCIHLLMIILSLSDLTVLCSGLSRYWIRAVFDLDIRSFTNAGCKVNLFFVYVSMQFSSWIRVSIIFERFLMTCNPQRCGQVFTWKKALISQIVILLILVGINAHFFWTNGLVMDDTDVYCGSLTEDYLYFDEFVFVYIDLVVLAVVPFVIILILSIVIIRLRISTSRRKPEKNNENSGQRKNYTSGSSVTRMLLISSFYFLSAILPISVYFVVDSYVRPNSNEEAESKLDLVWAVCYLFQYTIYGINFYIYFLANSQFRNEVKLICNSSRQKKRPAVRSLSFRMISPTDRVISEPGTD